MKATFEVVSPTGEPAGKEFDVALPIAGMNGKSIGLVWTGYVAGDVLADAFADLLDKQFESLQFIKLPSAKASEWAGYPDQTTGELAREAGIDAAIVVISC